MRTHPVDGPQALPAAESNGAGRAWIPLILFAALLIGLLIRNADLIATPKYEDGDFAANAILIDEAASLRLDHGNYSRFAFYHPGPALLYAQAAGQVALHDLTGIVPTPFNAHVIAILVLNASLIALATEILVRRMDNVIAAPLLVIGILTYALWTPGSLSSTWMPNVYIWPFLLFIVAGASVASGAGIDLWRFVLAAGLLVHGHVAFTLFVVVATGAVVACWIAQHGRRSLAAVPRNGAIAAGILLVAFILPIAVHTVRDFPGEIDDYLSTAGSSSGAAKSVRDVVRFTVQYWGIEGWAGLWLAVAGGLLALATAYRAPDRARRFELTLVAGLGLATVLTMAYAYLGADDLTFWYLAIFSTAIPILAWTVIATGVSRIIVALGGRTALIALLVTCASIAVVLVSRPAIANPYTAAAPVREAFETIARGTDPHARIVITFQAAWDSTAGIVEQARREDRPICVDRPEPVFAILFTDEMICDDAEAESGESFLVLRPEEEMPVNATVVFDGVTFLVVRPA